MKSSLKIFLISLAFIVPSLGGIYFVFNGSEVPPVVTTAESYQYYRDSVTLLAHDATGLPIVLDMDFSRKEKNGTFIHYYSGTLWVGEESQEFFTQFNSDEVEPQPHEFLDSYESTQFPDLSTRATRELSLSTDTGDLSFTVETEGDFLTKNTLDHTRFTSVTETTLTLGSHSYPAQILWENAYSNDYTASIFFEGRDDMSSETHLFTLWDEDGNFYHIDQTIADGDQKHYASHTWLLYKNAAEQSTQKSYEATVTLKETGATIEIPDWDDALTLTAPTDWDTKNSEGYISGTLVSADGSSKKLEGFFKNVVY